MPTFYIEQFGCRATQADAAVLERQLLDRGYLPATRNAADIVIVNTCTVTAAADSQARDAIRKIAAQNHAARVVVTGCYAQRAPEELASLPGVAWVVGNSHKPQLPAIIQDLSIPAAQKTAPQNIFPLEMLHSASSVQPHPLARILTGDFARKPLFSTPIFGGEGHHTRATLKIQDGCNSHCAYCVIPFVRGKSRSLPPQAVVQQINQLSASGVREVILSGINLGTYGRDLEPRTNFETLLRRILDETSVERLRVSSIEPMDVTSDLINFFAANDRIAQHFHMPLQSAADRILAAMHRWYRAEHYARRVHLIRERLPHAAIGADVIAGFPGESGEDHSSSVSFIESLPFSYLHVFSFSQRPGTAAAKLSGHVPANIIKNRARELRSLGERKSAAFRRSQLGSTLRVLTLRSANDGASEFQDAQHISPHFTPALSSNYLRVRLPGVWPANQWLNVRIVPEEKNCVIAEPEELPSETPAHVSIHASA